MKKVFLMFLISLCFGVIAVGLWTGSSYAQPINPPIGGLLACRADLNTCNADLGTCNAGLTTCNADLAACEAQPAAQAPQTGQTTCWDPADTTLPINEIPCTNAAARGEDGQVQAGVVPPSPRFTDNGDGTITDNLTGLIWLKNANCFGQRTWAQALTDANTLNSGECGLTDGSMEGDWYLPNRNELTSLLNFQNTPALPTGHPFTNFQSSNYWSSTTRADAPHHAWIVEFNLGLMENYNKNDYNFFVTAVRGG